MRERSKFISLLLFIAAAIFPNVAFADEALTEAALPENNLLVWPKSSEQKEAEAVLSTVNHFVMALSKVLESNSVQEIENEIDILVNNIDIKASSKVQEIKPFHKNLLELAVQLKLNKEEREILARINKIKRDNLASTSLGNALNPMILIGGPQMLVMGAVTVVRTAVEYNISSAEQEVAEMQALFNLRKQKEMAILAMRVKALDLFYNIYKNYPSLESSSELDRMTEATAKGFVSIIQTADPAKRLRLLSDNYDLYNKFADYYYYLGMGYIDADPANGYKRALPYLNKYESMCRETPIYRNNEKFAYVALAKLTNDSNISRREVEACVKTILQNAPNNGIALMYAALATHKVLKNSSGAIDILRRGIDNEYASDKDLLVDCATAMMRSGEIPKALFNSIYVAIKGSSDIDYSAYVKFITSLNRSDMWSDLSNSLSVKKGDLYYIDSYRSSFYYYIGGEWDEETYTDLTILDFAPNLLANRADMLVWGSKQEAPLNISYTAGISRDIVMTALERNDIEPAAEIFNETFKALGNDGVYVVKQSVKDNIKNDVSKGLVENLSEAKYDKFVEIVNYINEPKFNKYSPTAMFCFEDKIRTKGYKMIRNTMIATATGVAGGLIGLGILAGVSSYSKSDADVVIVACGGGTDVNAEADANVVALMYVPSADGSDSYVLAAIIVDGQTINRP